MDLERVAIRGWSFGGYLAALAVLRRPDVFHAAVAGAPVTEWRLYDTHYTERYLGDPKENADVYDRSSLLTIAKSLRRPLMLIHGLADDNVLAAHTLQMSPRAARGRTLAHRPAALGRHAHDTARGRRREPPLAAGRLHSPVPRHRHRRPPPKGVSVAKYATTGAVRGKTSGGGQSRPADALDLRGDVVRTAETRASR